MIFHTNEEIPTDEETLYLVYRYIWDVNLHNYGEYIPLVCKWSNDFNVFSPIASYLDSFNIKNCLKWAALSIK